MEAYGTLSRFWTLLKHLISDLCTYEEYVIKYIKKFKSDLVGMCNICYDENKDIKKCNKCVFYLCEKCYIKVGCDTCVHCKNKF